MGLQSPEETKIKEVDLWSGKTIVGWGLFLGLELQWVCSTNWEKKTLWEHLRDRGPEEIACFPENGTGDRLESTLKVRKAIGCFLRRRTKAQGYGASKSLQVMEKAPCKTEEICWDIWSCHFLRYAQGVPDLLWFCILREKSRLTQPEETSAI